MAMKKCFGVTAHKCTFSKFQIKRHNEVNWVNILLQFSQVKKNQAGDMGRQMHPQESASTN